MKRSAVSRPAVPPRPPALVYPDSDGQPIAETDFQRKPLWYANDALARRYRGRPDVYVSANLFVYYEEGNPRAVVAPDVFVVLGVAGHDRRTYKVWEEGKGPDFVLEVTSRSTRGTDQGSKRQVYAKLGVSEYWRFDPTGDYLDPPLVGERLEGRPLRALAARLVAGRLVGRPQRGAGVGPGRRTRTPSLSRPGDRPGPAHLRGARATRGAGNPGPREGGNPSRPGSEGSRSGGGARRPAGSAPAGVAGPFLGSARAGDRIGAEHARSTAALNPKCTASSVPRIVPVTGVVVASGTIALPLGETVIVALRRCA